MADEMAIGARQTLSRRNFLKAGLAAGASLLAGPMLPRPSHAQKTPPNIIFVLCDNQRWDFMGCAGHPFLKTPHMDRLAKEGVLFSNAFVTTSLCSPSRASFLTGQYAHTHGVMNNETPWNNDNVTFLEILKSVGYDTAFIGKWHMPGRLPDLRGVDRFVTFTIQKGQGRYIDCPLIVDGVPTPSRKTYITEELTDYALEFINTPRVKPFCLYLSHKAVHHRWIPPADMKDLYKDQKPPFPPEFDPFVLWTRGHLFEGFNIAAPDELYRNYARVVTDVDRELGRLLDTLDQKGLTDNTVVVYAGDNGFFWGEHHLAGTGRWAYEESTRVPLIVRAPGLIPDPGRRAPQMALNIDLAPSLLEMTGLSIPANMEGQSFVPVLRNAGATGRKAWLYEYFYDFPYRVPTMQAVRTDNHLYIEYDSRRAPELYDIVQDPRQVSNLLEQPEGKAMAPEMKSLLKELRSGKRL